MLFAQEYFAMDHSLRVIGVPKVCDKINYRPSKLYMLIKAWTFPKPRRIGGKNGWLERDVDAWILDRFKELDAA